MKIVLFLHFWSLFAMWVAIARQLCPLPLLLPVINAIDASEIKALLCSQNKSSERTLSKKNFSSDILPEALKIFAKTILIWDHFPLSCSRLSVENTFGWHCNLVISRCLSPNSEFVLSISFCEIFPNSCLGFETSLCFYRVEEFIRNGPTW